MNPGNDLVCDPDMGLTKREFFAGLLTHAIANAIQQDPDQLIHWTPEGIAIYGVQIADALIKTLNTIQPTL